MQNLRKIPIKITTVHTTQSYKVNVLYVAAPYDV